MGVVSSEYGQLRGMTCGAPPHPNTNIITVIFKHSPVSLYSKSTLISLPRPGKVVVGRILQPNVVWIHQGMMFFPQRNLVHHWFICITCYVYGYTAPQVLHDDF